MGAKIISIIIILLGLTFDSFSQCADSVLKIQALNKFEWRGSEVRTITKDVEYNGETYLIKYEFNPDAISIIYMVYPQPAPHYEAVVYVYKGEKCIYVGKGTYDTDDCCTYPISHIKKAINNK